MANIDPRTPVLVGGAQFTQRTVRRVLDRVKELLKERYTAGSDQ